MKYKQGYTPKINYWQGQYNEAKSEGNLSQMSYCLDKLTYFVQRQNEVYGHLGVGNTI